MLASIPKAHSEVVTSLCFSPHFDTTPSHSLLLCSTSGDDTAALWDGRLLISGTPSVVADANDSNESRSADGHAPRGRVLTLAHHRDPVNHALFALHNPHLLLTCSDDRTVAMWDLRRTDTVVGTLTGFREGVNKMMWLPSAMYPPLASPGCGGPGLSCTPLLASACDDGMVYIHVLNAGDTDSVDAAPRAVTSSCPSVASSSIGTVVDKFFVSTSTVNDMVLLPRAHGQPMSSCVLATASEDGAVRTWRLPFDMAAPSDARLLSSLDEFSNPVNHLAVVPSRTMWETRLFASPSSDHTLYRPEDAGETEDGYWLLAACSEQVFGVDVDPSTGAFGSGALHFSGHTDYVRGIEFVPSAHPTSSTPSAETTTEAPLLVTVSDDGTAVEWTLRDWPLPTTFTGHPRLSTGTSHSHSAVNEEGAIAPVGSTLRHATASEDVPAEGQPIRVSHDYHDDDDERDDEQNDDADADADDHTHPRPDSAETEMRPGGDAIFQAQLQDGLIMASAVAHGDRTIMATGSDTGDIKLWRVPLSATQSFPEA